MPVDVADVSECDVDVSERDVDVSLGIAAKTASSDSCHITTTPSPRITDGVAGGAYLLGDNGKSQLPGPLFVGYM